MDQLDVDILLATYIHEDFERGKQYLYAQLESLFNQVYNGRINIIIRDDGSTPEITKYLETLRSSSGTRITLIKDGNGNLGPRENFQCLMTHSKARYVFFSDQDDIWTTDKISKCVTTLQAQEAEYSSETPIMVHHDAKLIGGDGQLLSPSLDKSNYRGNLGTVDMGRMMMITQAPGFSIGLNRALINKAFKSCDINIKGHDTHIGLVAASLGQVCYIPEVFVSYRIHDNNASLPNVCHENRLIDLATKAFQCAVQLDRSVQQFDMIKEELLLTPQYLRDFMRAYEGDPDFKPKMKEAMENFLELEGADFLERINNISRSGFLSARPKAAIVAMICGVGGAEQEGVSNVYALD